jgi:hypothetical protein
MGIGTPIAHRNIQPSLPDWRLIEVIG